MLLGFKKQFHALVIDGSKTHTIRAKARLSRKAGQSCDCYGNARQKSMFLLGRWRCTKIDDIHIWKDCGEAHLPPGKSRLIRNLVVTRECEEWPFNFRVQINGEELDQSERDMLAWRDGFRRSDKPQDTKGCFALMVGFWRKEHGRGKALDFHGDMIHWDYREPVNRP